MRSHWPALTVISCTLVSLNSSQTPCAAWTAEADQPGAKLGMSVASAGDVNGDGYSDVLVGAPEYSGGEAGEGRAFLYLGSALGLAATPAWSVEGNQEYARLGLSIASAGDVNGDGFDDVIVGMPSWSNGHLGEGAAFVYLGSVAGLQTSPSWSAEGKSGHAFFGNCVASAGDVNGDGFDDVIVAAYLFTNDQLREGRVFVYLGSATGLAVVPVWSVDGNQQDAMFGRSVASAGDVNGDGFDDVLIGAPYFDDSFSEEGRVTLYLGSRSGPSPTHDWQETGKRTVALLGQSVAGAGDVNGDGLDDVILGAPAFSSTFGQLGGVAFVYRGAPGGLENSPVWRAEGGQNNAALGTDVASAGDVNGDGLDDVIVGAFQYELDGLSRQGRALAFAGTSSGLEEMALWKADSRQTEAWFGSAVAAAGDVNGDGFADVIVGAPQFDGGEIDEGRASVYHGSPLGLARSRVYVGDGINLDTIEPLDVVLGSSWSAPLQLGHLHWRRGHITLSLRTTPSNGANFHSPTGGRLTEFLISGPLLATFSGVHDGYEGDIPPQSIPNDPALLGMPWAAQYIVTGGGHADLSQAVYGFVSSCP